MNEDRVWRGGQPGLINEIPARVYNEDTISIISILMNYSCHLGVLA
jgi:hypothetical protein